jgi:hypothetical protein
MSITVEKEEKEDFKARLLKRGYQTADKLGGAVADNTGSASGRYRREQLPAIKMPESNVTALADAERACWVAITPAMATEWIKHVRDQRKYRQTTGMAYGRDMAKGNWLVTHQGIAFDTDWRLIDGQHRLQGIVRSGKTITLLVVWGLKVKIEGKKVTTMDAVDRGLGRSVADQLKLNHGASNPFLSAACGTMIATLSQGSKTMWKKFTMNEVVGVLELFGDDVSAIVTMADKYKVKRIRSAPVVGALAFARGAAPEKTDRFFEQLLTGANLGSTSPGLAVRNFLLSDAKTIKSANGSINRGGVAAMVLNGLRAFVDGRPMKNPLFGDEGRAWFADKQRARVLKVKGLFE